MNKRYWLVFFSILGLSVLSFSFSFITPLFFKILIDNIFIGKQFYFLNIVIIGMLCIFIVSSITSYFNNYLMGKLEYDLYKKISEKLFYIIQTSSMKNKLNNNTGDLITRVVGNVQITTKIVSRILPQIVTSVFTIIFPFIIMSYLNIYLALVTISPTILFIFLNLYLGKKIELNQKKVLNIYGAIFSLLKELFSIIPVIKAYNLKNWACEKFENKNSDYYSHSMILG
ncbi:MAG: ABC transporter ATP-binding protein [Methanobrevibacter sp.]|jgi:ABC-type bacteriocin/lantibiotic exporter with double-glycine peptidase domain|nr:ABC transporter ATP-binding protein [Candidatus Methanovirga meridionalis]